MKWNKSKGQISRHTQKRTQRRTHLQVRELRSDPVTHDRDLVFVAPESFDVFLDPDDRGSLVVESVVSISTAGRIRGSGIGRQKP